MRIQFSVPCVPVAQPRQRHRVVQTGGRTFAANYTPKTDPVNAFKAACQVAAAAAYTGGPLTCPVWMSVVFVFPRVKPAWLNKESRWWPAWNNGARIPHAVCRNDRDNLLKSLQDGLNGLVWKDDGQIYDGPTAKWLAADGEQPHVEVWIDDGLQGDAPY